MRCPSAEGLLLAGHPAPTVRILVFTLMLARRRACPPVLGCLAVVEAGRPIGGIKHLPDVDSLAAARASEL